MSMRRYMTPLSILLALSWFSAAGQKPYGITIASKSNQMCFSINSEGVYTALHGVLSCVASPESLKNITGEVFIYDDETTTPARVELSSIDMESDIAYFKFTNKTKPKLQDAWHYSSGVAAIETDATLEYWGKNAHGSNNRTLFPVKGPISNLKSPPSKLISDVNFTEPFRNNFFAKGLYKKKTSFLIGLTEYLEEGVSGAPVSVSMKGRKAVIGVFSSQFKVTKAIASHFDPKGQKAIHAVLKDALLRDTLKKYIQAHKEFNRIAKPFTYSLFKNSVVENTCKFSWQIPIDTVSFYTDLSRGNRSFDKVKDKKRLESGDFEKALPLAFQMHQDIKMEQRSLPFNYAIFGNASYEAIDQNRVRYGISKTQLDHSPALKFGKLLYLRNGGTSHSISFEGTLQSLNQYRNGFLLKDESDEKKLEKIRKLQERERRIWQKRGLDLDAEIDKLLRTLNAERACDSGLVNVRESFVAGDYCAVEKKALDLIQGEISVCVNANTRHEELQNLICENRDAALEHIMMKLLPCAERELECHRYECAARALVRAKEIIDCVYLPALDTLDIVQLIAKSDTAKNRYERQKLKEIESEMENDAEKRLSALKDKYSMPQVLALIRNNNETGIKATAIGVLSIDFSFGSPSKQNSWLAAYCSGFAPGAYVSQDSKSALQRFVGLLEDIQEDSVLRSRIDWEQTALYIDGFADGLPYTGSFRYNNDLDIKNDEVVLAAMEHTDDGKYQFSSAPFESLRKNETFGNGAMRGFGQSGKERRGRGKNYALSYLRACHARDEIVKSKLLRPDQIFRSARIVEEVGGEHRSVNMRIDFKLLPTKPKLERMESASSCDC